MVLYFLLTRHIQFHGFNQVVRIEYCFLITYRIRKYKLKKIKKLKFQGVDWVGQKNKRQAQNEFHIHTYVALTVARRMHVCT